MNATIDYQQFVNTVTEACCVMSVEKRAQGGYGEIRIVCSNNKYREIMGPAYYDNMPYHELVPQDNKFEDFCYRAAVLGQKMHAYVETVGLGFWTDQTLIPLRSDREDMGYCQFIFEFTKVGEADRMADVSGRVSEAVIRSCITLMRPQPFRTNVDAVMDIIMEESEAAACRIMLIDHEKKLATVFSDKMAEGAFPDRPADHSKDVITYDLMSSWEEIIGVSNALLIQSEKDMEDLAKQDPEWVMSMRSAGVTSLALIPLRRDRTILGYLYVVNFDLQRVVDTKEMLELLSYFLGSEISNHLLMNQLEVMSRVDALTGLGNRRAMIGRMKEISSRSQMPPYGVINIDLNGLKVINDRDGHDAGDRYIIQAGELLRKIFYEGDIFRTGGDELIIINTDISRETFERKAARLREDSVKNDVVSLSMGAFWSDGSVDLATAFRHADESMYADKEEYYRTHPRQRR